jgi:hypothetical protein
MLPLAIGDPASFDLSPSCTGFRLRAAEPAEVEPRYAPVPRRLAVKRQLNGIIQLQRIPAHGDRTQQRVADIGDQLGKSRLQAQHRGAGTPSQFFNTNFFPAPDPVNAGQVGTEGRNVFTGPGFSQADLSLFKNFAIRESTQAQRRIELKRSTPSIN